MESHELCRMLGLPADVGIAMANRAYGAARDSLIARNPDPRREEVRRLDEAFFDFVNTKAHQKQAQSPVAATEGAPEGEEAATPPSQPMSPDDSCPRSGTQVSRPPMPIGSPTGDDLGRDETGEQAEGDEEDRLFFEDSQAVIHWSPWCEDSDLITAARDDANQNEQPLTTNRLVDFAIDGGWAQSAGYVDGFDFCPRCSGDDRWTSRLGETQE